MNKPELLNLLTASAKLASLGRTESQASLNEYAANFAGSDADIWENLYASARVGKSPDQMKRSYLRLREIYGSLPDPVEAAQKMDALEKADAKARRSQNDPGQPRRADILDQIDFLTLPAQEPAWR